MKTIIDFDDLTGRGEPAISLVDSEGDDRVGVLVGGDRKFAVGSSAKNREAVQ